MPKAGFCEVLFNAPVCIALDAPPSEKPLGHPENRPHHFTYPEIRALVETYRAEGWDERAIVVRANESTYCRSVPVNWGVVIDLNTQPGVMGQTYMPIKVRWVMSGNVSNHWPEDLLLIHKSIDQWSLEQFLELQEKFK